MHWVQLYVTDSPIENHQSACWRPISAILPRMKFVPLACSLWLCCGLYFGRKNSVLLSTRARIESDAVWDTLDFLLNGVVFIVMGLQLRSVLAGISGTSLRELIILGLGFSVVLIVLRLVMVWPGSSPRPLSSTRSFCTSPISLSGANRFLFSVGQGCGGGRIGRCPSVARDPGKWRTVSAAKSDPFSNVLRHSHHSCRAGTELAMGSGHSRRWYRVGIHRTLRQEQQRITSAYILCLHRMPQIAQVSQGAGLARVGWSVRGARWQVLGARQVRHAVGRRCGIGGSGLDGAVRRGPYRGRRCGNRRVGRRHGRCSRRHDGG